jgi:putative sensory transduction regulator
VPPTPPAQRLLRFARDLEIESFPSRLVEATEEIPYDTLLVAIAGEEGEDPRPGWRLELSFLPGMEEQLAGASLLQCFVHLPAEVAAPSELLRLLARLNARLPLVGFAYDEEQRMLCFRHLLLLPADDDVAAALVVQATWMTSYLLSLLGAAVTRVARGEMPAGAVEI